MISSEELVDHVMAHAGATHEEANMAVRAVLFRIGGYLGAGHRQLLLEELPRALRGAVGSGGNVALPIEERIIARGITLGRAHELVASVFHVLAERLSRELLEALGLDLPRELAHLLVSNDSSPIAEELVPGVRDTLAEGRPGSHHPLSEVSGAETPPRTGSRG